MRIFIPVLFFAFQLSFAQSIIIHKQDAEVWGVNQTISGEIDNIPVSNGILFLNNKSAEFEIEDGKFNVPVRLTEGLNIIYIQAGGYVSDTLRLKLGYELLPSVLPWCELSGDSIILKYKVLENPKDIQLTSKWSPDPNNPADLKINFKSDSIYYIKTHPGLPDGEYYINLLTVTAERDTVRTRTFFTISDSGIKPFDIKNDHAEWIHSAVLYEITPSIFVDEGKFTDITEKIPELVKLGVNTIWLQPVYTTRGRGQGYAILDYFNIRADLGTETDLRKLIRTAKSHGLKVMFDFVPNHTSIHHPYAKQSIEYGKHSHYWDYYQREYDLHPYSTHYKPYKGFINYFWDELPNLNFDNPEVRRWITEAVTYWVKKFDIDGYRFDAVWGVSARNPQFTKDMRIALKAIKPELLLLAEDKATRPEVFDERFDAAFDWRPGEQWVSQWSWQPGTDYIPNLNLTIFNYPAQRDRPAMLRKALTNPPAGFPPDAKVLRFMANNDVWYFLTHHSIEQTRMAAALLFTLPGLPLVYNGDEVGRTGHPYWGNPVFDRNRPIDYDDPHSLFPYYQKLINIRKNFRALHSNNYSEIKVEPSEYVFGFRRWKDDQNIFSLINMSSSPRNVTFTLPVDELNQNKEKIYFLTDLISGELFSGSLSRLEKISITMEKHSAKIYLLSDSIPVEARRQFLTHETLPTGLILEKNSPDSFYPTTTIGFRIPGSGFVELSVYDQFGRKSAVLFSGMMEEGDHKIIFEGSDLPPGIYTYKLNYSGYTIYKRMMLKE